MNHSKSLLHTPSEYSLQSAADMQQAADATNVQAANNAKAAWKTKCAEPLQQANRAEAAQQTECTEPLQQTERAEITQQTESAEAARLLEILQHRLGENASGLNGHLKPRFVGCCYRHMRSAIAYRVQDWQLNPYQEAHGGILAAMFDTAMGITAHWLSDGAAVTTVDLLTNYIAPVPADSEIIVYSHVQKAGRTLVRVCAEARICPPETDVADRGHQKLAASACANFMVLR